MYKKPIRLLPRDTIGIIAPCGPVQLSKLNRGIQYVKNCGYKVILGEYVTKRSGYLAGSDAERLSDIHSMFSNPEVKAIYAARGGYGSIRLLDKINYELIKNNPKIFSGYSDVTALQLAFIHCAQLVTFSGLMVAPDFGEKQINSTADNHFWSLLKKDLRARELTAYSSAHLEVVYPGLARGIVIGGCLTVLLGCIGTQYCPDFTGALLVLEDVGEELYRIDRAFATLKQHKILKKINGLVLGQFVNCRASKKRDQHITIRDIVEPIAREYKVPTVMNFSYGHIPEKLTVPFGILAELDTRKRTFTLLEDAVN